MSEIWKAVEGFETLYEVSNLGRVRRLYAGGEDGWRILKPGLNKTGTGYYQVTLSDGPRTVTNVLVHHLVGRAFIGPRPEGALLRHLDGDSRNNRDTNLVYGTPAENQADRIRHGTHNKGERHGVSKLTDAQVAEIKRRYRRGYGPALAAEFGVARHTITRIAAGKTWSHIQERS